MTFAHEFFAGSHAEELRAVLESRADELGATVEAVFGCRKLAAATSASYEALRDLLARASDPKLGWATGSFESTAPPPNDPTT